MDEFTGRTVPDRHLPDGLQAAVEIKEGMARGSGGTILGTITLQHFLACYPQLAGMTATAQSSATEFAECYGLATVVIPPNKASCRTDYPDQIYVDKASKVQALLQEVSRVHHIGQPV